MNTITYSLAAYPAGNGTTATGDATFNTDIPDNAGVALFNTSNPANFSLGNRFDTVGSTNANALYREGPGFAPLIPFSIDYSFVRRVPALDGNAGLPEDNDNNRRASSSSALSSKQYRSRVRRCFAPQTMRRHRY